LLDKRALFFARADRLTNDPFEGTLTRASSDEVVASMGNKVPSDNLLVRFLHKRKSFEHEREVRALIHRMPASGLVGDVTRERIPEAGLYVPVNLDTLVERVLVSPLSKDWIVELVGSVTAKYRLSVEVVRSDLYDGPLY